MFTKVSLFAFLLSVFTASMHAAAMVTCMQPGSSITVYNSSCSVGIGTRNTLVYSGYTGASVNNGAYMIEGLAEILSTPVTNPGPYPMSAYATWDDLFTLPGSNSTDLLKITVTGGGLNHNASIQAGPIDYAGSDFCDAHYTGNPACTDTAIVSAANLSSIRLSGFDSFAIKGPCNGFGCGANANSELYERVTIQRFLADGVTADPFTTVPEPSTTALLLLAIPAGFVIYRRR